MHGRIRRDSERCRSLQRIGSHHMRSVLRLAATKNTVAVTGDKHCPRASLITTSTTGDSFFKDGRKISIGDCALFEPHNGSPPFIGLIRRLSLNKEKNLELVVNWLYRSSQLKLDRDCLVSAPNEVFYSFHKDKIPAASLLHPCKVAFLPSGVELPTRTFSSVCRRVYDITNKSLRWLTDQGYINAQQEEVDQLLHKTRTEMHVTLHSAGRSPKQTNVPTTTSQLKPASDSGQNSGASFPTQTRGRKRERVEHGLDPAKRERTCRTDEGDSGQAKTESSLKCEIARITEKGGVVDVEGVEKLVQLMQPVHVERKMDLVSRFMIARAMASTNKVDCLKQFVQLRGLPVLDEWLQDIHKGKVCDSNLKDGGKSVEEFLLVILRALDKLPVDLQALQMCNIGRSVNHLRSHKNIEIQRKARTLVDTWKKRVEAEMMSTDAKCGSTQAVAAWPSKSRLPEASHGGSRTPSGSDVAIKSSITQNSASKSTSLRSSNGDSSTKYATSSPGSMKPASSLASGKVSQPKTSVGVTVDAPQTREDRSSSSNQSHNYGQSSSPKDDVRSYTSGSRTANKKSSGSRSRKISVFSGTSVTESQKETNAIKSSSRHKGTALEKSHSALSSERVVEGSISDGNTHKLIVKIPNRVRSPAQGVNGGSLEDPTFMSSRSSSPALKHEQSNNVLKAKSDTYRCNAVSDSNTWQDNDPKNVLIGSAGAGSHTVVPDEEQSMMTEDSKKIIGGLETNQLNLAKLHASSFSPMNALIESCVRYSELTSSSSLEDDGMNLLASVAAEEISRSNLVSPANSTESKIPTNEDLCNKFGSKSKSNPEVCAACDGAKFAALEGCLCSKSGLSKHASLEFSGDRKCSPSCSSEDVPSGEDTKDIGSSSTDLRSNTNPKFNVNEKPNERTNNSVSALPISTEKVRDGEFDKGIHVEKTTSISVVANRISNCTSGIDVMVTKEEDNTDQLSSDECKPMVKVESSIPVDEDDCKKFVNEGLSRTRSLQKTLTNTIVKPELGARDGTEKQSQADCCQKSGTESSDAVNVGKPDDIDVKSCVSKSKQLNFDTEVGKNASHDLNNHLQEANAENQEILEQISPPESRYPMSIDHESQKEPELTGFESAGIRTDYADKCPSAPSSASGATDPTEKLKFDLKEGLNSDDGKCVESVTRTSSTSLSDHMINSVPSSINAMTGGRSASVTVTAAGKGPLVPQEDFLRNKLELGWKGCAATSAFRLAETRKALEMPLVPTNLSCPDASTSKSDRILFDFDLNVPDERVLEEMVSRGSALAVDSTSDSAGNCDALLNEPSASFHTRGSGILDLDLNRVDETNDIGLCSTTRNRNGEASPVHSKPNGLHVQRDFDLNNGPVVDDVKADQNSMEQVVKGGIATPFPSAGIRMDSPGLGSFSSWFPSGSTYSTITMPSMLPDRVDQHFQVFPPGAPPRIYGSAGGAPYNFDVYHGSVLSSSPAVPFTPSPFQFPVFPFGSTYPLSSATFSVGATSYSDISSGARLFVPPINSLHLGPVGSFASQFQRPYAVSLPDISNNGGPESNRNLRRQGLDLNTGPGAMASEAREETMPLSSGQRFVPSSQSLSEEQFRMFSVTSSMLKRKEPEGSWDSETFRHKQPSWQ